MKTGLLQEVKAANQAITRLVSEFSHAKASSQSGMPTIRLEHLTAQLSKIEKGLGSLPRPGERSEELAEELRVYAVNLNLLKKEIEELAPLLEEKRRLIKEAVARLNAATSWSRSLKDLSR
jgi:hypothetical protein